MINVINAGNKHRDQNRNCINSVKSKPINFVINTKVFSNEKKDICKKVFELFWSTGAAFVSAGRALAHKFFEPRANLVRICTPPARKREPLWYKYYKA